MPVTARPGGLTMQVHYPLRLMIPDAQGLRESRSHGAAEPQHRSDIDGFAAFAMNKPAVTVVLKKRRGTAELQGDHEGRQVGRGPHSGTQREERRPRVYQVGTSASTPSSVQLPTAATEQDNRPAGEASANAVVETLPTKRRRARRNPAHAPGEVTRTVFEAPRSTPAALPAPRAESDARSPRPFEFIERAEVGYEQVMAELEQLSAKVDLARGARKFRVG
jgi:hypothetical protein